MSLQEKATKRKTVTSVKKTEVQKSINLAWLFKSQRRTSGCASVAGGEGKGGDRGSPCFTRQQAQSRGLKEARSG